MTVDEIVAEFNAVPVPQPRTREWLHLRMQAMRDIRKTGMKVEAIGELFGVHHSIVVYACNDELREKRKAKAIQSSRDRGSAALIPAAGVRRKLAKLKAVGVGARSICDATGCSPRTLLRIRVGAQKKIHPDTAVKILAVDETCIADRGLVRSGPTWNLLQELIDGGWNERELARLMGLHLKRMRIYIGVTYTTSRTAMKVKRLYDAIEAGKIQRPKTEKVTVTVADAFARRAA